MLFVGSVSYDRKSFGDIYRAPGFRNPSGEDKVPDTRLVQDQHVNKKTLRQGGRKRNREGEEGGGDGGQDGKGRMRTQEGERGEEGKSRRGRRIIGKGTDEGGEGRSVT